VLSDVRRRFGSGDENAGAGAFNFVGGSNGSGSYLGAHQEHDPSSYTAPPEAPSPFAARGAANPLFSASYSHSASAATSAADAARSKRFRHTVEKDAEQGAQSSEAAAQRSLADAEAQLLQLREEHSAAVRASEELRASESRLGEENKLLKRAVGILEGRLREASAQGAQASERVRVLEARQAEAEAVLHRAADYVARLEAELAAARRAAQHRPQQQYHHQHGGDEDEGEGGGGGGYFGGYTPDMPPPDVY
jgi:hypothetical protein